MNGTLALIVGLGLVIVLSVPEKAGAFRQRRRDAQQRKRKKAERKRHELDMGVVLTEVATRLRSGAAIDIAWDRALEHSGIAAIADETSSQGMRCTCCMLRGSPWRKNRAAGAVGGTGALGVGSYCESGSGKNEQLRSGRYCLERTPRSAASVLDQHGVPHALRSLWAMNRWRRWRAGINPIAAQAIAPTIAVCRMGNLTGAPLAEILDSCAAGVIEAGEASSARDVAMAGPQSSAHMLAVLPLIGIALGYVMGADPFGFLFHTHWGHLALAGGVGCEIAGIAMVNKLVREAKKEAEQG